MAGLVFAPPARQSELSRSSLSVYRTSLSHNIEYTHQRADGNTASRTVNMVRLLPVGAYRDRGWAGIPEFSGTGQNVKVSTGPGGESLVTVRKHSNWNEGGPHKLPRSGSDGTAATHKLWRRPSVWYLKVLGQAPPVQPPTPPRLPIRGEPAAFGLWPRGEVTVRSGEAFELDAMGVFLNDPYDAVNLSDKVTWTLPEGLIRGSDGTLKATKPGTYPVSVAVTRPDGRAMTDTIRITVR